ncbi:hypothetical protein SAMN05216199_0733 [Pedococcus cremeus]|jgi:hypothetical protein|uniref:Uncharacterized protein n=1 Tax=Pedococcus cremeus TaxID=587636 RepID=A0A1H9QSD6_9MICO|nr:hypothetical protein [Pedococcus cremeus]SER63386.1 hypothetical protein SAMN05216199_0733 [Pedococcus cremeus]
MSSSLVNLYTAAEEHTRELPMSPYMFGALALAGFALLLAVLWMFRGAAGHMSGGEAHTRASERG